MKKLVFIITFALLFYSCSLKTSVNVYNNSLKVVQANSFIIFKENDTTTFKGSKIAEIHIKDAGLTLNCDYETVMLLAKKEAQKLGANCLKITQHKYPSVWGSSCHQIKAIAYFIENISPFEKEISWSSTRRLQIKDFKGSVINRPAIASTSASLAYNYTYNHIKKEAMVHVSNIFNCDDSYFKKTSDSSYTLLHEQGHFDISEIFSRKLRKEIQTKINSKDGLDEQLQHLTKEILQEYHTYSDRYDTEIYADKTRQFQWTLQIQKELNQLEGFAPLDIIIHLKDKNP